MKHEPSVRALAAKALFEIVFLGKSLPSIFSKFEKKLLDLRDRSFLHALLFESCRWYIRLDALLAKLLDQPLHSRAPETHCLLVVGLTQLTYLDIPDYAVVADTVNASRHINRGKFSGLVNAVLRRYLREKFELDSAVDRVNYQHFSHPSWLVDQLSIDWPEEMEGILAANNIPAPLWLRVNQRKINTHKYYNILLDLKLNPQFYNDYPDALLLANNIDIQALPGYAEGWFSVQDGAAQIAVDLLDLKDGQRILDACAAPGGKSSHILERATVSLLALDFDAKRLSRMQQNLMRLGLQAELKCVDASEPETWWNGQPFDRILLDAPCSATGIIYLQPDIKLQRHYQDIDKLTKKQNILLKTLWPLLKPGGRLVYATCSVLKEENERQINRFLQETPGANPQTEWPVLWGIYAGVGRQNLPATKMMDGFFYAILEKAT